MKAKQLIYTVLIGIFILFSGNTITSQERRSGRSQGKRSNENSRSRVKRQSTRNYTYQSNAQSNSNKYKHKKDNKHQKYTDNHCHLGCTVVDHHPSKMHVHSNGYNHHSHYNHYVYHRRLPSKHYISFAIGYDTFYHCQGRFYSYVPGRGYLEIELQLPTVRYAPHHCTVTRLNGYSYYHNSNYYYIPFENGFYRVRNNSAQVICRLRD